MFVHDTERPVRLGMPEAVLCEPKSDDQLVAIVEQLRGDPAPPTLFTRLEAERYFALPEPTKEALCYHQPSATAQLNGALPKRPGSVTVVAAGTSDLAVASEAQQTLEFSGLASLLVVDVGVAGLWRLEARLEEIRSADVVIVVAGMDGALTSVVAGLVGAPVIAVPTSVGYGVAKGGETALAAALTSCAQGLVAVNIDNGFGAACAALRILGKRV